MVSDCVKGEALLCSPNKELYIDMIKKAIAKLFFLHGQKYSEKEVLVFLEAITESYQYETPETILMFLKKAGQGDFGKFYGQVDIGTLREWFADFLQYTIIPERERFQTQHKERYDNQREQQKSLREVLRG